MSVTLRRPAAAPLLAGLLLLGGAAVAAQEGSKAVPPEGDETVDAAIAASELRGHVRALASDALRGREMGSPESLVAAEYCAARMAAAGVAPGGDDGTYMQEVPLVRVRFTDVPRIRVRAGGAEPEILHYGEDFTFAPLPAPAPEGPLRVVLVRDEDDVPDEAAREVALVMAASARQAGRWLEAAGHPRGAGFGLVVVPRRASSRDRSTPRPALFPVGDGADVLRLSIRGDWGERIVAGDVTEIELDLHEEIDEVRDVNVVGVVAGAGTEAEPERADEIVVLTAHRDHIGVDDRVAASDPDADAIRNGADDDASGCAAVLEIVEAIAAGPAPARTVVAVLVTGEERGFVGSRHWVAHPTHPIENLVCALNFEMLGRPDELVGGAGGVWLTGDERSDLGSALRGREIVVRPDPRPAFNFFTRSDNVPFARAGVVAQTLSTYGEHEDYHRVSDEWDTLDYEHMETAVGICLGAVRTLASGDLTPRWNEGEPRF